MGVDIQRSFYLVLSWNKAGWYQLHQFSLRLADPKSLTWTCPISGKMRQDELSRRIVGQDSTGSLFEWYGESGGQLKYYPFAKDAIWASDRFRLEPLKDIESGILAKAAAYFPDFWNAALD
jgi:hypothetical protein